MVEEINLGFPASKLPAQYFGMGHATLQGCHRGLEIKGISQRPALVSADFRGNVAETYIFPLSVGHDLTAITEVYGREHLDAIRALRPDLVEIRKYFFLFLNNSLHSAGTVCHSADNYNYTIQPND